MTDEPALIAACLAKPQENTPRLMYADWLDEHGSTEQHKARSEWIRLTCGKNQDFNGIRQAGEPDWIHFHAHRLWPALASYRYASKEHPYSLNGKRPLIRGRDITLRAGVVVLRFLCKTNPTLGPGPHVDSLNAVVRVYCSRGITSYITVPFLRAAQMPVGFTLPLAALVARDEPLASITFGSLPHRTCTTTSQHDYIYRRPFVLRGLGDVWDGLEGWVEDSLAHREHGRFRAYAIRDTDPEKWMRTALDASLTRWARKQAGVEVCHV